TGRNHEASNANDLLLLLSTLVPAILMDKAGVSRRIHAAGIRVNDGTLLLSGAGRIGKSTITTEAWERGFQVLGDDWLVFGDDFSGVSPVPKPMKARMTPEQFSALKLRVPGTPIHFGNLFGEGRVVVGRMNGFYNDWDHPLPVSSLVFLECSDDEAPVIERIPTAGALPLILSQTILCRNSVTLAGVAFARSLSARNVPIFRLRLGSSTPEATLDKILEEICR
ncbi:MAG: hypothetical protein WCN98_06640, partial [Verrucomicrobiaceae bacterium]